MASNFFRSVSVVAVLTFAVVMASCGSIAHTIACDTGINNNSHCTCGPCPITEGPEFLYASSQGNSQILTLSIDHSSGALGAAVSTPATADPAGMAAAQNQFLYLSNTGSNDIDGFSIDQTTGALTTIAGSPFLSAAESTFNPEALVAGTDLYAASIDGIAGFTIASDGSLGTVTGSPFTSNAIGGVALGQSTVTPVNYFLYASDFADPNGTISGFTIDTTTGILTPVPGSFTTGVSSSPAGIVFDSSMATPFVFVALQNAGQIAAFSVDPSTGILTAVPGSPFSAGDSSPYTLALNSSETVLYELGFLGGNISAYSIASNGVLAPISNSPFNVGGTAAGMVVTQDDYMYVSLPTANGIVGFSIGSDGTLTTLAGSPFSATGAAVLTVVQIPPS